MKDLTGFVLAGGKSTRMGSDKAFLQLDGRTLLTRALEVVRSVCEDVHIVGSAKKFSQFAPTVDDIFPNQGPLAGIHAALKSSGAELNLVLAVDMPFMNAAFTRYLIAQAREGAAVATVPHCTGGWQPLCAVYRGDFADAAEEALRRGENKIDPLFARVPMRIIEEPEILRLGFGVEIFRNLNTPEEFTQAQPKDP
jgi:molybdenum cofactor guanylyltransferase